MVVLMRFHCICLGELNAFAYQFINRHEMILFQNVTKGARTKIVLSLNKLRERQSLLRSLEKVCLERLEYCEKTYLKTSTWFHNLTD